MPAWWLKVIIIINFQGLPNDELSRAHCGIIMQCALSQKNNRVNICSSALCISYLALSSPELGLKAKVQVIIVGKK
jgi:hypothetical protein